MLLVVISGASRGFGQAVAVAFAHHASDKKIRMRAILTARSKLGLEETKRRMLAADCTDECDGTNDDDDNTRSTGCDKIAVSVHPLDLGADNLDALEDSMSELIDTAQPLEQYDNIVIINNAGSLGNHLGKISEMRSLQDFYQTIHINITSCLWFTSRWTRALLSVRSAKNPTKATVVNVSSLCAIQPFPTMATYCAGKAARDMFHQSLAKELENENASNFRILNYAPGAMDTAMTVRLRDDRNQLDPNLKKYFQEAHEKGELIDPMDSASKLVHLLICSGDFESGAHVDYWVLASIPDAANER